MRIKITIIDEKGKDETFKSDKLTKEQAERFLPLLDKSLKKSLKCAKYKVEKED